MENVSFSFPVIMKYPIKNCTDSMTIDCELRFSARVQAKIADAVKYAEAGREHIIRDILRQNAPGFMKEAIREVAGDVMTMYNVLNGAQKRLEVAACRAAEALLSQLGLCSGTFVFGSIEIIEADLRTLRENEDQEKLAKLQKVATENLQIDLQYWPEMISQPGMDEINDPFPGMKRPVPPQKPFAEMVAWDCRTCGMKKITSKFCPECGSPSGRWICTCGSINFTRFCPECGSPSERSRKYD